MRRGKAALSVLVGVVALIIAAYKSPYVEGEATRLTAEHSTVAAQGAEALVPVEAAQSLGTVTPAEVSYPDAAPVFSPTLLPGPVAQAAVASAATTTAAAAKASPAPDGYKYWKTIHAKVTAYDPGPRSCGKWAAHGKTSTGESAWVMDGVAADPKAIPYGTYCDLPGIGFKMVDDTGGAMRHSWRSHGVYHLDLRVARYSDAVKWGVKYMDVDLYKKIK